MVPNEKTWKLLLIVVLVCSYVLCCDGWWLCNHYRGKEGLTSICDVSRRSGITRGITGRRRTERRSYFSRLQLSRISTVFTGQATKGIISSSALHAVLKTHSLRTSEAIVIIPPALATYTTLQRIEDTFQRSIQMKGMVPMRSVLKLIENSAFVIAADVLPTTEECYFISIGDHEDIVEYLQEFSKYLNFLQSPEEKAIRSAFRKNSGNGTLSIDYYESIVLVRKNGLMLDFHIDM